MFDQLKGMAGLAGIMKDLPRIKARMEEVKASLVDKTVEAQTGGGAVTATVNGLLKVVSIHIDQSMMAGLVDCNDPADQQLAQDLIVGAVNAAIEKARAMVESELAQVAEELGVPLPAEGLPGLLQ